MPAKSKAQLRKLAILLKQGKITKAKFDEFARSLPKNLPERVKKKKR